MATQFVCPDNGKYNTTCQVAHLNYRYTEAGAAWTLISAMIMFFMRAGFLLIELSFAEGVPEKRKVVLFKYLDVAATAIAFWLFGFQLSHVFKDNTVYVNTVLAIAPISCNEFIPYIVWFFKYGFASNTATLMGGLLIRSKYKLRLWSAFISSFLVSGLIHSTIARFIWGAGTGAFLSPYRFCDMNLPRNVSIDDLPFNERIYLLDFAGGGAVHLVGGIASLALTLFVSFQLRIDKCGKKEGDNNNNNEHEHVRANNFREYMYPNSGGQDEIEFAALGVFILWFGWFAFNCGTTESLEGPMHDYQAYSNVAGRIAVNMITCVAGGVLTATIIAGAVELITDANAINCNEIANGILTALVSITSNCPYVDNVSAFFIGVIAVFLYHLGVFIEYKLNIFDTGRVIPVHAFGGIWSLISTALFTFDIPKEYVKETYEGVCYCNLNIPILSYGERLGAQIIGAILMIVFTFVVAFTIYFIMYIIRFDFIVRKIPKIGDKLVKKLNLGKGGLLLVGEKNMMNFEHNPPDFSYVAVNGQQERIPLANESMNANYLGDSNRN